MKPALTDREWELVDHPDSYISHDGLREYLRENYGRLPDESNHALAALALYKQPFGFTREDVELLKHADLLAEFDGELHSLIERIEALLPPKAQ